MKDFRNIDVQVFYATVTRTRIVMEKSLKWTYRKLVQALLSIPNFTCRLDVWLLWPYKNFPFRKCYLITIIFQGWNSYEIPLNSWHKEDIIIYSILVLLHIYTYTFCWMLNNSINNNWHVSFQVLFMYFQFACQVYGKQSCLCLHCTVCSIFKLLGS